MRLSLYITQISLRQTAKSTNHPSKARASPVPAVSKPPGVVVGISDQGARQQGVPQIYSHKTLPSKSVDPNLSTEEIIEAEFEEVAEGLEKKAHPFALASAKYKMSEDEEEAPRLNLYV